MRVRLPNPEADILAIQWGVKDGFPLCCIAQFVNDHYNVETYTSGCIRRGTAMVESHGEVVHYVPCFECDEELDTATLFDHRAAKAWTIRRPKPLIAHPTIEVR